jgi:hypothetical protein
VQALDYWIGVVTVQGVGDVVHITQRIDEIAVIDCDQSALPANLTVVQQRAVGVDTVQKARGSFAFGQPLLHESELAGGGEGGK